MLRASRRLLRPRGRLAYFTIAVAAGLSPADHRRAVAAGPPSPSEADEAALLSRAGFGDVGEKDVTPDYLATARAWRAARLQHRDELRPVDPAVYDDRLARGESAIAAIEDGLLRRTLYVARSP